MAPFRFRLEQLLRYRKQLEDQAQQAFAKASALLQDELEKQRMLCEELCKQQQALADTNAVDATQFWLIQHYVKSLHLDLDSSKKQEAVLRDTLNTCRIDLLKKAKDRELLDTLKEKQAKRHAKEELLIEQRMYDETATLRSQPQSF